MKKSASAFCEPEIHTYLDSLCASQFYGKLTFFFQNGIIESCRTESTLAKKDIISKQRALSNSKTMRPYSCKQSAATPHKIVCTKVQHNPQKSLFCESVQPQKEQPV